MILVPRKVGQTKIGKNCQNKKLRLPDFYLMKNLPRAWCKYQTFSRFLSEAAAANLRIHRQICRSSD
jgi:hypothetical protein